MIKTHVALSRMEVFQELCKASEKWGLYISFDVDWYWGTYVTDGKKANEIALATNRRLVDTRDHQCVVDGQATYLFDTEESMINAYLDIVGDDGPTEQNTYDGEVKVYAITCDPEGCLLTENT